MEIKYTAKAERQLQNIAHDIQKRIVSKMRFFAEQTNPLHFAKPLHHPQLPQYRFRIGDYRVNFDVKNDVIVVMTIKHRKESYDI